MNIGMQHIYKIFTLILGVVLLTIFIPRLTYEIEHLGPTPSDNVLALAIGINDRLKKLETQVNTNTQNITNIQQFINNTKAQLQQQVGS